MYELQINLVHEEQLRCGLAVSKQELALLDSQLRGSNKNQLGTRKGHYLQEGGESVALFVKRFVTDMMRAFATRKLKPTWWYRLNAGVLKRFKIADYFPLGGFNLN